MLRPAIPFDPQEWRTQTVHAVRGEEKMLDVKRGFAVWMVLLLWAAAAPAAAPPARAKAEKEKEPDSRQFLRLKRDKDRAALALETAIVRCAPVAGGLQTSTVDLVAAVHIADAAYYKQLNREFEAYDAVLYELVAAENAKTPKPTDRPGNNPLSALQSGMTDILNLEFQLKGIDYARTNMVHADMSPDQLAQAMQKNGESVWTLLFRAMGYSMTQQNQGLDSAELLGALLSKDRALALKRVVAVQFDESNGMMALLGGTTLISGRNRVALEVLRKQLAAGKQKIAIFYGAGHMPDFQKRLRDDFGMQPVATRWLAAWDLKTPTQPKPGAKPPQGPQKKVDRTAGGVP
jgi:hypothetical protein